MAVTLASTGCGGGERQDAHEPSGKFKVEVVRASFPGVQKLAKRTRLEIAVRNADTRLIPNIAVTLDGLEFRSHDPDLADPRRPQFLVNGQEVTIAGLRDAREIAPASSETANTRTWALGPMRPGQTRRFVWDVTAVVAGPFRLHYTVAAGLNGKAKAVDPSGATPTGSFIGTVSSRAPQAHIAADGHTVIKD